MHVVVIGAGSIGANLTYRLASMGAEVTLVDSGAPGSGASVASFAWVNAFRKGPRHYFELSVSGMQEHARLVEELGGGAWHHGVGALHWEDDPKRAAELHKAGERMVAWGYRVAFLTRGEAASLEPDLAIGVEVSEVLLAADEGYVEMTLLIGHLLDGARKLGAETVPFSRVAAVRRAGDRVVGVTMADGHELDADLVVDCAGALSGEVAALAGCAIPLDRVPGRLVYSSPVPTTLQRVALAPGAHFRPDGGGRIVLSDSEHDTTVREGADWTPEESLEAARRHLGPLAGARVEAARVGVRPMPTDGLPIVGRLPGVDGFAVAVCHSGVTLGPLLGRLAATELLGGVADERLAPYRPDRFATAKG